MSFLKHFAVRPYDPEQQNTKVDEIIRRCNMKRQDFDHNKLEGPDVDIDLSLKGYGIAWIVGESETLFYYGTLGDGSKDEYDTFDFAVLSNDADITVEYDWADLPKLVACVGRIGCDNVEAWLALPLQHKITDLLWYYGHEDVFGSTYYTGLRYDEIVPAK
jgi:hypothetical protein